MSDANNTTCNACERKLVAAPGGGFEFLMCDNDACNEFGIVRPTTTPPTPAPRFTPGPWSIYEAQGSMPRIIVNSNGNSIADANAGFPCSVAEQDANARLIAATPSLYAIVKAEYDSHGGFETLPLGYPAARAKAIIAALAQAEGKQ